MDTIENINKSIRNQHWRLSMLLGCISATMVFLSYIRTADDPGSASSRFGHNLTFYLPMILGSILIGLVGFAFYISSRKGVIQLTRRNKLTRKYLPLILLIPASLHLLVVIINIFIALIIK